MSNDISFSGGRCIMEILYKELTLVGLNCASCAVKIEEKVLNIAGVRHAAVDFVNGKLIIEAGSSQEMKGIIEEAKRVVQSIEPGVKAVEETPGKSTKGHGRDESKVLNRQEIIKLSFGAGLFFIGLLFRFTGPVEFALYLTSYIFVGGSVLLQSIRNIGRGRIFDENFLMSLATIGAFSIGEFPEGVAVMLFYQIGEFFQESAIKRSRKSIRELMDIRPDFAYLKRENGLDKVSPEEVKIGDVIVIKPGEKLPLDGKIIEGAASLDTSALTGESLLREVGTGDDVMAGFVNKSGVLTVEVTKEFGESTVSRILDLVQNASSKKAPTENFITRFAKYYTPAVVIIAASLALLPPLIIPEAVFSDWIYRALVFLVISCPCALVISIPLGFFGGIGGASRNGILIKGSNYLEALNNVETVVFDKTGTLTKGVFKVTGIKATCGYNEKELLEYAAYAESYSNHPIAQSIMGEYGKTIDQSRIRHYEEVTGLGIKAGVFGKVVLAGSEKLLENEGITFEAVKESGTIVYISVDGKYAGYITISDEIKEDAVKAIKELKAMGIRKLVMLTGDRKAVGQKVGELLGLDEVHAELLPDQKVDKLEELGSGKAPKGKLIFVGDGINDAPVLARADIGVAMGGLGSDAAIEAADVVIMTDEPSKIPQAIRIAKRTKIIIWQNIWFSFAVKLLILALGAGGLATMWEAVFADVGVALIAVINAMRILSINNI